MMLMPTTRERIILDSDLLTIDPVIDRRSSDWPRRIPTLPSHSFLRQRRTISPSAAYPRSVPHRSRRITFLIGSPRRSTCSVTTRKLLVRSSRGGSIPKRKRSLQSSTDRLSVLASFRLPASRGDCFVETYRRSTIRLSSFGSSWHGANVKKRAPSRQGTAEWVAVLLVELAGRTGRWAVHANTLPKGRRC
jgi:hypothetical protein